MAQDITKTKLKLQPYQIVLRPLVTEKSFHQAEVERFNAYTFEVNPLASKADIRHAVEELFDVKVVRVNIQNRKGKKRRGRVRQGKTRGWKKAIVKLDRESRINFF